MKPSDEAAPAAAGKGAGGSNKPAAVQQQQTSSPRQQHGQSAANSSPLQQPASPRAPAISLRQPGSSPRQQPSGSTSTSPRQARSQSQPGSPRQRSSTAARLQQAAPSPPASPRGPQQRQQQQQPRQLGGYTMPSPRGARNAVPSQHKSGKAGSPRSPGRVGAATWDGHAAAAGTAAPHVSSISLSADLTPLQAPTVVQLPAAASVANESEQPSSSNPAVAVLSPPGSSRPQRPSTLDTGGSDDGLTVQLSQLSGLIMQQLASPRTLQQQQQQEQAASQHLARQQQLQRAASGAQQELLARALSGATSPATRDMRTPALSYADTHATVHGSESGKAHGTDAATTASAAEAHVSAAAAATATGSSALPGLPAAQRWRAYRVTLEEQLTAATGVLSSTGHLPEWLASARTTRQSSTGDPYISGSFTAAGWGYQHTGFGSVQQTEAGTPHPAAAAAAVVSSAAEADAAAVLLVEGSGGSKGGFGSLSPFVCAGEVVSDGEEAEVLGALQQQLQLAEELLRKHGLIQAYGRKLAAAEAAAVSNAPTANGQGGRLAVAAGMCSRLCGCAGQAAADGRPPGPLKILVSPVALLLLLAYVGATVFYLYTRASRLADLGPQWWYGLIVLVVEVIGVSSMLPYGLMLVRYTTTTGSWPTVAAASLLDPPPEHRFHVRVLVPCYKESLGVVRATLEAVLDATLPPGASRTVYLCDDGADPQKRHYVAGIAHLGVMYVSGRTRAPGEINGKSGNLNNALASVYQQFKNRLADIPATELVVVFDADMQPKRDFFVKVLDVMRDRDTALCLTPQAFSNVCASSDIFNHVNPQFWMYVLPGCDALGYVACTGTNVCIRAKCLAQVGWFPTYTITEDYALSQELKMAGFKGRYLPEYLAVGEAPEEIRAVMRQRSRWCKGHMQVFFSTRCPLFQRRLSFMHKLLYTNGTWAYFATILTSLNFTLVPFISLVLGWHPVTFSRQFALACTLYLVASTALTGYVRRPAHGRGMWLSGISNYLLAFTFFKAVLNTLLSKVGFKDTAAFKATAKKLAPVKAAVMRAARVTVTVVASALHSIAGFAGRSPPATRAASGLSVQASRDVLTRGRSLGDATATVSLHEGSNKSTSRLSLDSQAAAAAHIPAHRGLNPHGPRRASLLGPGSAAPHAATGLRTPSQLQADGDAPSALAHAAAAESGQGEPAEASAAVHLQPAAAMHAGSMHVHSGLEKLSHLSHSSYSSSQHLPAVVESPVESARHSRSSNPEEAAADSASPASFWGRLFGRSSSSASSAAAQAPRLQSGAQGTAHPAAAVESPGCCGWFTANWDSLDGTLYPLALLAALCISFAAISVGAQQAAALGARFGVSNPSDFLSVLVSARMDAFMVLAMLWAVVNAIPPLLCIVYFFTKGWLLRWACHLGQLLGLLLGVAAIWCLWVLVPLEVNPRQVLPGVVAFFDAQRSGPVLAAGTADLYPWLKPSGAGDAVPGGFYMGADYVKHTHPMATSLSLLAWSLVEFKAGYQAASVDDQAIDILSHGVKYLMRCHNAAGRTFVVQIGEPADYVVDTSRVAGFWGLPEHMPTNRTVYRITDSGTGGSDVLAAASAALAAASVAMNATRPMLAAQALTHARQLYDWASSAALYNSSYCGSVVPCAGAAVPLQGDWTAAQAAGGGAGPVEVPWVAFPSSSALDDLAWAGVWLHRATGTGAYLADAELQLKAHFRQLDLSAPGSWMPGLDNVGFAAGIMLQHALPDAAEYKPVPAALLRGWMTGKNKWAHDISWTSSSGFLLSDHAAPAHTVAHVGMLSLMLAAAEQQQGGRAQLVQSLECFAMKIATSLLGGGLGDQPSYVVGYGSSFPRQVHHRQASCPAGDQGPACTVGTGLLTSQANPNTLTGALVFGPDASGVFSDDRTASQQTGVGLGGNTALSGLLSGLLARDVRPGQCNGGRSLVQTLIGSYAP